jgi:hypothetical protein
MAETDGSGGGGGGTEFVGSREKANNAFGQNGYQGASSLTPGQTKSPIADVAPKQASVPGLNPCDTIEHRVKMDGDKPAAYANHSSMAPRAVDNGSPGGLVPQGNGHRNSGKTLNPRTGGR